MPDTANDSPVSPAPWRWLAALAVTPAVVGAMSVLAPHWTLPEAAVDVLTFAGACLTSLGAVTLLSRWPVPPRARLVVALLAGATMAAVGLARWSSALAVVAIAAALVGLAHAVGDFIGSHIEHPGHILPACVVAACIDITSVFHPSGPTHAVIASPRALALLAVSFPILGTRQHAPVLGVGDILFVSLLLGVARAHTVRWWKVALASIAGVAVAGVASATLQAYAPNLPAAVPALPAIGAATIIGVREMRILRKKDRRVAYVFMVGAVVLAAATLVSRYLFAPRA